MIQEHPGYSGAFLPLNFIFVKKKFKHSFLSKEAHKPSDKPLLYCIINKETFYINSFLKTLQPWAQNA